MAGIIIPDGTQGGSPAAVNGDWTSDPVLAQLKARFSDNELLQLFDVRALSDAYTAAAAVLATARADVYSYLLKRRRAATLTPEPARATSLVTRWVVWQIHSDRRSVTKDVENAHKDDVAWLEEYTVGKQTLGDAGDPTVPEPGAQSGDRRHFTAEKMKGW